MWIVMRTYNDPNNGQPSVTVLGTVSDQAVAEDLRDRCKRASQQVFLQLRCPTLLRTADQSTWKDAAQAALGALDPGAVTDPDNPLVEVKYIVEELVGFVEPSEDPPANEEERILRDIRDRDPEA